MNLPDQFLQRMQAMLGPEYDAFSESFHRERYGGLRVNLLKTSVENFQRIQPFSFAPVPWCSSGFYYDAAEEMKRGLRPGKHPLHEAGLYYIQEPSAMAVAEAVRPLIEGSERPLRVLDLCAAPGGKSSQLAAMMKGRGFLVSNEIHPARAKILSQNMERMGLTGGMVTNHAPEELSARFPQCFDVILVDAPCSGEGMFRKDEDTIAQWSRDNVEMCARRQKDILTEAAKMLAPGGTLVYSTCTFAPAENEAAVLWMIRSFSGWEAEPVSEESCGFCPGRPEWIAPELDCDMAAFSGSLQGTAPPAVGTVSPMDAESANIGITAEEEAQIRMTARLWPHRIKGEGHFVAKLWDSFNENGEEDEEAQGVKGFARCEERRDAVWQGGKKKQKKKFSGSSSANRFASRPPAEWEAFAEEFFDDGEAAVNRICGRGFRWLMFGEQLYAAGSDCPGLDGLTVLRPGLHLGTVKKGRLEPSHALAMALTPEMIEDLHLEDQCLELWNPAAADGGELAGRYLKGEALAASALPQVPRSGGWNIVTYRGFPLGWAKVSGGMVKNHYPKGLRWV